MRRPCLSLAVLLLVMGSGARDAQAQWQNFRTDVGLPDNRVVSILEAFDGALWFATSRGAGRFDGARWSVVEDSLPTPTVTDVLEDRRFHFWFATPAGVARHDGERWSRYDVVGRHLPDNQVFDMIEDRRGDLWFGTANGLVRHDPARNEWRTYPEEAGGLVQRSAWSLFEDSRHRLWIATPRGVSCLDSARSEWTTFRADPARLASDSVFAVAEDHEGAIWFGTYGGAFRFDGREWKAYRAATHNLGPSDVVYCFARDRRGGLWAGTAAGVARFDGAGWRSHRSAAGVPIGAVHSLRVDRSGNVWMGTTSSGVFRFDGSYWQHYFGASATPCADGTVTGVPSVRVLGGNCVRDILADRRGDLWFADSYRGLARFRALAPIRDTERWALARRDTNVASLRVSVPDTIRALYEDRRSRLWIASPHSGVAVLDSARAARTIFTRREGMVGDTVSSIFEDAGGDLWFGTTNGAARLTPGGSWSHHLRGTGGVDEVVEDQARRVWLRTSSGVYRVDASRERLERLAEVDSIPDLGVRDLLVARDGSVWLASSRATYRLKDSIWTVQRSGSGPGDTLDAHVLFEDSGGNVWVGITRGVARWDGHRWRVFLSGELGSAPVTTIFEDAEGGLWVATGRGMARWNGISWRLYNRTGGLPSDQLNRIVSDRLGRLWIGTNAGAAEYESDHVAPQTIFVSRPPRLAASRTVSFAFAAAYGEANDVEFSHRWNGGDFSAWSPVNQWELEGVGDSVHTFEVRSRDWAGNVDTTFAAYSFEIDATPPAAMLSSPSFGQPVRGRVALVGTADDRRLRRYRIETRAAGGYEWTAASLLGPDTIGIREDTLAVWDTASLADGDYEIRLAVTDTLGLEGVSLVRVIVDNVAPFADVTTPVRITAARGGDVYTTHSELHLYFPPQAFAEDVVARVAVVPDSMLADSTTGVVRVTSAFDVSWGELPLRKNAVLDLTPSGARASGVAGPLAIYAWSSGVWKRLGGTGAASGAVSIAIREPGRYALFAETSPASATYLPAPLTLSPRVFSAARGQGGRELAIGFTMRRPGPASVHVYNRAGRLVKRVVEGAGFAAGANLVRWDGRDRDGRVVEPGLYVVTVAAAGETQSLTVAVVE